jgi:hypothetical protein
MPPPRVLPSHDGAEHCSSRCAPREACTTSVTVGQAGQVNVECAVSNEIVR